MFSIPHLAILFVIVLIVFGPHKLPELARGLGKLLAEFRKASTDFKTAFEEEMRDLERQAQEVERRKQAETAATAARAAEQPATLATPAGTETPALPAPEEARATEAPVIVPVEEAVARGSTDGAETEKDLSEPTLSENTIHDQQQRA